MGNSGSHFLGFLFAVLSMYGDYATKGNKFALLVPAFILFFPVIDTLFLIIVRLRKGIIPLKKSDDHMFLLLLSSGCSLKNALSRVYFVSFLWAVSGLSAVRGFNILSLILIAIASFFTIQLIVKTHPSLR